jgi:hypothetical protein
MPGGHLTFRPPELGASTAGVLVGLALALAACGGGSDGGYGPGERAEFVEACSAGASAEACGCFYDRLADEVPHDRFEQVDQQIRDDPQAIPDDIADLAVECSAAHPDTAD